MQSEVFSSESTAPFPEAEQNSHISEDSSANPDEANAAGLPVSSHSLATPKVFIGEVLPACMIPDQIYSKSVYST